MVYFVVICIIYVLCIALSPFVDIKERKKLLLLLPPPLCLFGRPGNSVLILDVLQIFDAVGKICYTYTNFGQYSYSLRKM